MMEEFKQGFIDEALQLIEKLEGLLIELENRSAEEADIQEIFRIMHTIKGSAAMFGFSNTEKTCHLLEDVYDKIRLKEMSLNPAIVELAIKAADVSKVLVTNDDSIVESVKNEMEAVQKLAQQYLNAGSVSVNQDSGPLTISGNTQSGDSVFYIRFKPDEDVLLRGINPISVFEELEDLGKITGFPYIEDVPMPIDYDPSKFYIAWDIFVSTSESFEDVEDCFLFYLSHEFKVIKVDPANLKGNAGFLEHCLNLGKGIVTVQEIEKRILGFSGAEPEFEIFSDRVDNSDEVEETTPKQEKKKSIEAIKVESQKLDELINLVSELVTLNSRLEIVSSDIENEQLRKTIRSVSKLSKRFRDNALELRLIPIKVLVLKMQRLIRDLSNELGKEVEFITEGTHTELDKNIIARLEAPLMHILRNCLDHGLELPADRSSQNKPSKGVIRFVAFYSGSNVYIQIQDDGRGIDPEKVKKKAIERGIITSNDEIQKQDVFNLLFAPGFSTADSVSTVSGRGVGLDVVKKEITEMRGEIDIESEKNLGTSITLKLPLTLSIIDTMMVRIDKSRILVPREYIVHSKIGAYTASAKDDKLEYDGKVLPVINMCEEFGCNIEVGQRIHHIVLKQYDKFYAITVEKIIGEHQAVVKPMGHYNGGHDYFSGASILGDGSLAFILDINKVINAKRNKSNIGNYNLK